jgi:DNA-binding transcriptional regulator PaaX
MSQKPEKKKTWPKKLGTLSLAILWCLAERGAAMLGDLIAPSREGLGRKLRRSDAMKDIEDCYEILQNLDRDTARTVIWRLRKKGLVEEGRGGFNLTGSGKEFFQSIFINKPQRKWDNKWRIVMFDVPESRKGQRDLIRQKLLREDYQSLQKSVFIGKYPIGEDLLQDLIERDIYQYLRMIVVGEIDDEGILEKFS